MAPRTLNTIRDEAELREIIGSPVEKVTAKLADHINGLTQRVWVELRRAGHDVTWQQAVDDDAVRLAVDALDPDLLVCPFLRERVPDDVWRTRPTVS